jgi:DNA primase
VRVASLPDGEDPDSYVAAHGRAGIERAIVQALDLFERQLQLLERKGWFADLAKARRAIDKLMPTIRATADGMTRALYVSRLAAVAGVDAGTIEREAAQPETPRRGTLRTGGGIPDGDAPPWDDAPMGTPPDDHFAAPPAADDGYAPPAPKPPPLDEPKWKGKWRGKAQAPGWRAETAPPAVRRGMLVPGPDLNLVALLLEERAWLAQAEQGVEPRFIADPRLRAIYDTLRELGSQASLDELELALGESAAFAVDAFHEMVERAHELVPRAGREAHFAGILMQLRLRGVETLAREVQADLDAADPADAQTVAALRAELAELQAERRRLRAARHGKAAPGA